MNYNLEYKSLVIFNLDKEVPITKCCCVESIESLCLFNRLLLSLNSWLVRMPDDNSFLEKDIKN